MTKAKDRFVDEHELISNFMGLPFDLYQKTVRPPLSIEELVDKVWEDWGIGEEETKESTISGNWQKIVGRKLSGKCAPVSLSKDGKSLHIRASSSTIKQEIGFRRSIILKALNKLKGCGSINELRIY